MRGGERRFMAIDQPAKEFDCRIQLAHGRAVEPGVVDEVQVMRECIKSCANASSRACACAGSRTASAGCHSGPISSRPIASAQAEERPQ
jgi:hypothetical protein